MRASSLKFMGRYCGFSRVPCLTVFCYHLSRLQALKVLRQLEKSKSVDVMPLARLYAGVMCDRLTEGATPSTRYCVVCFDSLGFCNIHKMMSQMSHMD